MLSLGALRLSTRLEIGVPGERENFSHRVCSVLRACHSLPYLLTRLCHVPDSAPYSILALGRSLSARRHERWWQVGRMGAKPEQ